jgi:hypothetical protein
VVEYGDGWIPIPGRGQVKLGDGTAELQRLAAEAGRDRIPVTVFGARPEAEVVEHYAASGVDRCAFWVPPASADEVLPLLDSYAALVSKLG